jgi:alpha-tubulin suppressor-like RCC1 family protein
MRRVVLGLVMIAATACRSPTQITFEITTNVPCSQLSDTWVTVGPLGVLDRATAPTTVAPRCTREGYVGSVVVVPSGGDGDLVAAQIVAGVGVAPSSCAADPSKCIVAKRGLRFIPHEPLTVRVALTSACEGVACAGSTTCVDGACKDAIISDSSQCTGAGCGDDALPDGGAPVDAGATDATIADAAKDAPSEVDATIDAPHDSGPLVTPTFIGPATNFGCALLLDHTVKCWGHETDGLMGNGVDDAAAYAETPIPVPGLTHVARLAVGQQHACAVLDDGGVMCWGYNGAGATGTGHPTGDPVPAKVPSLPAVGLIAAGQNHTCVASVDGRTIYCWGYWQAEYQGTPPTQIAAVDAAAIELAGGWGMSCGRFDDGNVRCWGGNLYEALGQGSALTDQDASSLAPLIVPGLPSTTSLCVGGFHACVLDTSHAVTCWGDNGGADLGLVDAGPFTGTPVRVAIDPHVTQIACGNDTVCVLYDDAGTQCWGINDEDELGIGDPPPNTSAAPVSIPNLGPASQIYYGGLSGCAVLVGGGVACFGNNDNRQLGAGSQVPARPVGAFPVSF